MITILHNIRSLHNVGSIFRTADGAGIDKIYLCGITPSPLNKYGFINKPLAKTALGAQNLVAWEKIGSSVSVKPTINLIKRLKSENWHILAIEQAKNSIPYFNYKTNKKQLNKTALIFGPEVTGLPASILKAADKILEIPMHGQKNSLNVSVSFGVVVYYLLT